MCPHGVPVGFQGVFQGTRGNYYTKVTNSAHFYSTMLKDFLAMIEKGKQTFDMLEAVEVIQICCAAEESVKTGKPVRLG
jgi:predicted dehydrogenase